MPIYMKYPGIKGTVKGKHAGWIELLSAQMGVVRHVTDPSGSGKSPTLNDIVVTKWQDSTSSGLFSEALNGTGKTVTLEFVDDQGVVYLTMTLENTLISSFTVSGRGGQDYSAVESLALNFTKISHAKVAAVDTGAEGAKWQMAA